MKRVFGFEIDDDVEMDLLRQQLDLGGAIITERLVDADVACEFYDAHVTSDAEHSFLGCNLNEAIHELGNFLQADVAPASQRTRLHLTVDLVNTVWERITDVCKTLEVPSKLWCANEDKFRSFKTARRWANFMKHPDSSVSASTTRSMSLGDAPAPKLPCSLMGSGHARDRTSGC